jgi:hypothetical protein
MTMKKMGVDLEDSGEDGKLRIKILDSEEEISIPHRKSEVV